MSKKRKITVAAVLVVLVLAVGGIAIASSRDKGAEVRTETVARRDLVSVVTASGYIQPKRKVDISADISGRVIELPVVDGQWVERGDLLLRIDPSSYQAAVRRAEAAVAQAGAQGSQARANLLQSRNAATRAEQLAGGDQLISQQELEQARTATSVAEAQYEASRFGVAQARAALSEARDALRKTTIVAPMSGRITRLNIEEGETAVVGTMNNPGSLLLTISDPSEMEARVQVDETDVPHMTLSDSAVVRVDAFPDRPLAGRVTRISNSAIQNAATAASGMGGGSQAQAVDFEVVITLVDPPAELRPDLSATAEIVTARRDNVLAVPIISLTVRDSAGGKLDVDTEEDSDATQAGPAPDRPEVEGVFVVRNGKAEFTPVRVGITGEQYFEVSSGLKGGETVVSGTYQTIRELSGGDEVRVPEPEEAAS